MTGALSRRDIEMIFRAETDKATRPIGDLTKDVRNLRGALEEQVKAAQAGDVSLDNLAKTTRDLKKAQDELGTARALLTALNAQEAALGKAEAKLESATEKYAQLKTQVEGAEAPTKRLTNQMEAAGRAQAAAAEQVQKVGSEVAQARQQIEGIIGPVSNFGESFKSIADASKEIARGLNVAGEAADDFKQRMAAAQAGAAFDNAAMRSPVSQESINFISQFENRVELLRLEEQGLEAQRRAAASAETARKARQRAEIDDVLGGNKALEASFAALAAEQERIDQVSAFQKIASDANAAATDVSRFGAAASNTATDANRLANAILEIVAPATAANRSLDGLEASVVQAAAVLDGDARSSLQQYNVAMNELSATTAAASRIAKDIDAYRVQQTALDASTTRFREAQAEVLKLANALSRSTEPTDEMATALRRAEAALEAAGQDMQRQSTSAAALSQRLKAAGVDVNALTAAENRLTVAAREAAQAQREIAGKTGGSASPLGFSLQDMQNLGYQVNDLITQVASGTPITQAFAQQFGQIYQIPAMQNLIARFAKFIPLAIAAGAAVGVVVAALNRINDRAEALRAAEGYLARIGEGGDISAAQIAKASIALQDLGVSAKDAMKIIGGFNDVGLNPEYLDAFTSAVKAASIATGMEMPEAAALLTTALAGGYEEVVKLDEVFNFLTVSEREQIRAMYESGQESEARRILFERFFEKMDQAADKSNGSWSNAWDNLKGVFRNFLDVIGDAPITIGNTITSLNKMRNAASDAMVGLNAVLLMAQGYSFEEAGRAAVQANGRAPGKPAPQGGDPRGNAPTKTKAGQDAIAEAKEELVVKKNLTTQERLLRAEQAARKKAPKGASDAERAELASLARQKESNVIAEEARKAAEKAAKSATSGRNKAAREAETLQNRIAAAQESLQTGLDGMDAKVARAAMGGIDDALRAAETAVDKQYDKLFRKLDDFSKLTGGKGKINGTSIVDFRAQLEANKTILTNQEKLKAYEDQVNAILNERKSLLADIEDRAQRGAITSAQAIKESVEVTSRLNPTIVSLADAGTKFALSIAGANPSPELQAFIAKLDRISGQSAAGPMQSDAAKAGQSRITAEEQKLNDIISARNNLIAANQVLVELGLLSQVDAQAKAAKAFKDSQGPIEAQILVLKQTLDTLYKMKLILPQVYDMWMAKLGAVSVQAQYTNENALKLNMLVQDQLLKGGMEMFDSLAQGLAGLANGTASVGDAFNGLLNTFLNFAATFLAEIAKMIMQALILQAIQSAFPGMGGAGGGGGGLGGLIFGTKKHTGGTMGDLGSQRRTPLRLSPAALDSLPRYHNGTKGAGLKNNEMLAVLERGEKVLTEEQQRKEEQAKANGAAGGGAGSIRNVLAFGDDEVASAMSGPSGEKVLVSHIRRNKTMIKQMLKD